MSLFPGFLGQRFQTSGAEINYVMAGAGAPVLLLHGYPQTHALLASHCARTGSPLHRDLPRLAGLWRFLKAPRTA